MKVEYDRQRFQKSAVDANGCGYGTENACYALIMSSKGYFLCAIVEDPCYAQKAGILLDFRLNIDESDKKVWCPLGVLGNSKV
jgi:hypothetical protein